ncbi:MAG: hypothetical protein AAGG44_20220, partial [Planctomycetota bacterium]
MCLRFLSLMICFIFGPVLTAAEPIIESVSPPVAHAGSKVELSISGEGFSSYNRLVFYSPKIRCLSVEAESDYDLTAVIQVDETASPINQPFRVLSDHGFSDLRTIRVGNAALHRAMSLQRPGRFQVEATIAALHANARTADATDWPTIATLYGQLVAMTGSPVVVLNHAVAL